MPRLTPDDLASFDAFRAWIERALPSETTALALCNIDAQLLQWAYEHIATLPDMDAAKRALLEWALESCSIAALPQMPADTETDTAGRVALWWNEIDICLSEYRETHQRGFAPETCAHLVWFAVEWRANQLAAMIRQILADDDLLH